jgi:hypothetical protein
MLWHLTEIFSLLPEEAFVAPYLFMWQHEHVAVVDEKILEELKTLQAMKSPESSDQYWSLLTKFAIVGLNRYICDMLSWHSSWKYDPIIIFVLKFQGVESAQARCKHANYIAISAQRACRK